MTSLASFKPSESQPSTLRAVYEDLYSICAKLATRIYSKEFDQNFLFEISIDGINLIDGVVLLSFTHDSEGKKTRYQIAAYNDQAPYSKTWPEKLKEYGAFDDCKKSAQLFKLI